MQNLQSVFPLFCVCLLHVGFFCTRTRGWLFVGVAATLVFAAQMHAEDQVSPAPQGDARATDADGYVWVDKEGKELLSNFPRDARGAPLPDSAGTQSTVEDAAKSRKGFYQWTDASGVTHLTDRLEKVPKDRRETVVMQPLPEGDFVNIELSPAARIRQYVEQLQYLPRRWVIAGAFGVFTVLLLGVVWRQNRKVQPEPGAFSKVADNDEGTKEIPSESESWSDETKLAAHYKLIGVDPDALSSEVRKAYHRRMGEYHPDKVASLGQELRELAEAKSREINEAYEAILFYRGEA